MPYLEPMALDTTITGNHHITVIAGDPLENLDFYVGMRLGEAHPGTDLTFFPWPDRKPGRRGIGLTVDVALAVPFGSLTFWAGLLTVGGVGIGESELRFGERGLTFKGPPIVREVAP